VNVGGHFFLPGRLKGGTPPSEGQRTNVNVGGHFFLPGPVRVVMGHAVSPWSSVGLISCSATGVSSQSTFFILRTSTNSSRLVPMVP
jgi:hypothetical protein